MKMLLAIITACFAFCIAGQNKRIAELEYQIEWMANADAMQIDLLRGFKARHDTCYMPE